MGACDLFSRQRWELRNEIRDGPLTLRVEFIDHSSGFPGDEKIEYRVLLSTDAEKTFKLVSTGVSHDDLPLAVGERVVNAGFAWMFGSMVCLTERENTHCGELRAPDRTLVPAYLWAATRHQVIDAAYALARLGHPRAPAIAAELALVPNAQLSAEALAVRFSGHSRALEHVRQRLEHGSHMDRLAIAAACVPELTSDIRRLAHAQTDRPAWRRDLLASLAECGAWPRVERAAQHHESEQLGAP